MSVDLLSFVEVIMDVREGVLSSWKVFNILAALL